MQKNTPLIAPASAERLALERFAFGANWRRFLDRVNAERVQVAMESLKSMLGEPIAGRRFLDIGCGSGLFSLAARELGACVHSFDYDPASVACTLELKRRFRSDDPDWTIEQGSALDADYIRGLGPFDVVYSWGVLHHTGDMWRALELAAAPCAPGAKLFIAIYNDQGGTSRRWRLIKLGYNRVPEWLRLPYVLAIAVPMETKSFLIHLLRGRLMEYIQNWTEYSKRSMRGMSRWTDLVDWIGGYPFEVAKPEEIFDFYRERAFQLTRLTTCGGGLGCNQFVFRRVPGAEGLA